MRDRKDGSSIQGFAGDISLRGQALFGDRVGAGCAVTVILPAKDEERLLPAALEALAVQVDAEGRPLDTGSYEVLVLLNNCSDGSGAAVRAAARRHPEMRLHVAECTLPVESAHVGTARRMLMDAAWQRQSQGRGRRGLMLSTDADTAVAPDWISQSCAVLRGGADVVGGVIEVSAADCAALRRTHPELLLAYQRDRQYQRLVARLESVLDPDPDDPWPRHLEHFGASLGCTTEIYARAGGLPAVSPLEDMAFVAALRRVGARIRHAPEVRVRTSGRLEGRAEVGLSWQLRRWSEGAARGTGQRVPGAMWTVHRLRTQRALRQMHGGGAEPAAAATLLRDAEVSRLLRARLPLAEFLDLVGTDSVAERTYEGDVASRTGEVTRVIHDLERWLSGFAPEDRDETGEHARSEARATLAV